MRAPTLRHRSALAGWLFGLAVLAGVVLRPWVGDALYVTRYTGYLMPWLLVALVPGAAAAWWTRRRLLSLVLCASAALIVASHAPLFRARPPVSAPPGLALRVMSYNTWSRNADVPRIADVILRERPDVLLVQESLPEVFARLTGALGGLYGGAAVHVAYDPKLLQGVVSRYPIESSESMRSKGKAQRVALRSPAGLVTVFNVHPLRRGGWRDRYARIAELLDEDVAAEGDPVILGGDFNAPDRSQLFAMVAARLKSAHGERGFGFGFTYPARLPTPFGAVPALPLMRIDHLFFSRHFVVLEAGTLADSGGSDHRPVVAEVVLPTPAAAPARAPSPVVRTTRDE